MSGTFALLLGNGSTPFFNNLQYEALVLVLGLAVFIWYYWSLRMLPALTTSAVFYYTYYMYLFDGDVAFTRFAMFMTATGLIFMSLFARIFCCFRTKKRHHHHRHQSGSVEDQVAALSGRLDTLTETTAQRFDSIDQKLERLAELRQINSSTKVRRD